MKKAIIKITSIVILFSLVMQLTCVSFASSSGKIETDKYLKEQAMKGNPIDKYSTQVGKELKNFDRECGFSEFFKSANPNDKDFTPKFKKYVEKVDKYNKKYGYKTNFNIDQILNSNNLFSENLQAGDLSQPGTETNDLHVESYDTGDICLPDDDGAVWWGAINHAGIFNKSLFNNNYYNSCFLSAEPDIGVVYESPNHYRTAADRCYSVLVLNTTTTQKTMSFNYAAALAGIGEPYSWYTTKDNYDIWYCSKIPYIGYLGVTGINIDYDGGYWVWPIDIYNDSNVYVWNCWE